MMTDWILRRFTSCQCTSKKNTFEKYFFTTKPPDFVKKAPLRPFVDPC